MSNGRQARLYDAPADFRSGVRSACAAVKGLVDELAAGAAHDRTDIVVHELGTPVAVISGALETLADHSGQLDHDQRDDLIRTARRQAGHLAYLLDHLLVADEEHGGFQVSVESVDLTTLTQRVVGDLASMTAGRSVQVANDNGRPPRVSADPHAVRRILAALMSNALKYSPSDSPIGISIESTDHTTVMHVTNDGPGIPDAERQTIFLKGRRLNGGGIPGSGLGLYLARGLAQAQGGSLQVVSRTDGIPGTTFSLRLPHADG